MTHITVRRARRPVSAVLAGELTTAEAARKA